MDFKFEPGNYALVGRETIEGRDVLRIEHYPTKLFTDDDEHEHREHADEATERGGDSKDKRDKDDDEESEDEAIERRMNKVALITLWVDPTPAQIIRYTFDNVGLDFLPGRWLVRVSELKASMEMGLPFPDVWLPRRIQFRAAVTLATGTYPATFDVEYRDYRLADVKTKIKKVGHRGLGPPDRAMIGLALAVALAVSQAAGASGPKIAAVRIHGNHTTPDAEVLIARRPCLSAIRPRRTSNRR